MTLVSRARYWLPLLPLLGLLAVTYWLNQLAQPEPVTADAGKRHDPDAVMKNFSAVKLDERGEPRLIVSAKQMLHYPDDDSTALEMPRLVTLSRERPAIHTTALRGFVSSKGDDIFLHDDVVVVREPGADREKLTLRTSYLHVIPEQDLAKTDRAVTIADAHNTVHATGLEMDNKARTLKLLSHVTSEHVPNHK